jgi:MarR family transcriptional regulator, organic hydroperoxide resistance regulator
VQDLIALQRTVHAVVRALEAEASAVALSPAELNLLACMGEGEAPRVGDLVERTGQRASTLTSVLNRLERRGLARRLLDPLDRRSLRVELTDSGRAAHPEVVAAYERIASCSGTGSGSRAARAGFLRVLGELEQTSLQRLAARSE